MVQRTAASTGLALAVVVSIAAPACAASKATAQDVCFARSEVEGFSAPNDHTVYLRVFPKTVYRLDLFSDCIGLSFRESLGLEDRPSSPWICSPLEATVVYRDHGMRERCPVTAIHKLTPEEAAALPRRDRP